MTMIATITFGSMSMAQCLPGEGELQINVTSSDNWGYEGYIELTAVGDPCGTNTVAAYGNGVEVGCGGSGSPFTATLNGDPNSFASNTATLLTVGCFPLGTCFDLHYVDDYSDGGLTFDIIVNGVTLSTISGLPGDGTATTICVTAQPALDLRVDSVGIGTYFTLVPMPQVVPLSFEATLFNFGTSDVTNAMVTATVNDGVADVATATSTAAPTLVTSTASTGVLTPGYTAVGLGTHTVTFVGSMTEVDEDTSNDTMVMMITYNDSILGRDNGVVNGSLGFAQGAADNSALGTQFTTPVADELTSVSAFFNAPTPGDSTKFSVYDMVGGMPNAVVATTATYVFAPADSAGVFLTLPVQYSMPAGDFVVVAHEYGNNVSLAYDLSSQYEPASNWLTSIAFTTGGWDNGETFNFGVNFILRANFASGAALGENTLNTATVYPNPTKGNVTVTLTDAVDNATVTVYSVAGNVVSSDVVSGTQFTVNLDGLTNGLYIMELSNGSEKGVYRIVKD